MFGSGTVSLNCFYWKRSYEGRVSKWMNLTVIWRKITLFRQSWRASLEEAATLGTRDRDDLWQLLELVPLLKTKGLVLFSSITKSLLFRLAVYKWGETKQFSEFLLNHASVSAYF